MAKEDQTAVRELLRKLCDENEERLTAGQVKAFKGMLGNERPLTAKQVVWIQEIGERLGLDVAPAANVFSKMPKVQQDEHAALVHTRFPWERGEMVRPLKPPGR